MVLVVMKLCLGKPREVNCLMWVVSIAFMVYVLIHPIEQALGLKLAYPPMNSCPSSCSSTSCIGWGYECSYPPNCDFGCAGVYGQHGIRCGTLVGVTRTLAVLLGLILAITAAPVSQAAPSQRTLCKVSDPRLSEISGMATSRRHPQIVWVHNDSGDAARVYGLHIRTCAVVAELNLRGVQARDFEAMAVGVDDRGRSVLWLADIGDNRQNWSEVRIHQVREPKKLGMRTKAAVTYRVRYNDGSHDAETILADPGSTQLWLVTKKLAAGALYRLPKVLKTSGVNVARRIQSEGGLITDGAVSPRGDGYVLRDYLDARIFRGLPPGRLQRTIELPFQVQGEAITWSVDGQSLLTISERDDRLMEIPLGSDLSR